MSIRLAVVALLAVSLGACVTFEPVRTTVPIAARGLRSRDAVRVTTRLGETIELTDIMLAGDSLVGVRRLGSHDRHAVALGDIDAIAVAHSDVRATLALIGGTAAFVVLLLAIGVLTHSST